jgi:hypothetical protein
MSLDNKQCKRRSGAFFLRWLGVPPAFFQVVGTNWKASSFGAVLRLRSQLRRSCAASGHQWIYDYPTSMPMLPDRTRRAYQDDIAAFLRFVEKPLRQVKFANLVAYGEILDELAPASRARKIGAREIACELGIGYLAFDIGALFRLPAVKSTLAERILGYGEVPAAHP